MPFAVLLFPFFGFAAAFVLIGLSQTHSAQHGTSFIKSLVNSVTGRTYVNQLLNLANRASRALISRYGAAQLKHMTAFLNGMAELWKQEFAAMRAEAHATAAVAGELERAIPREAKKAAAPAMARAKVADRHATHALGLGHANAKALNRFRAKTRAQLRHDAHAIDVTIPHDLAGLRARNKALEREQTKDASAIRELENGAIKSFEWIRAHPLSAVTGVFAGAVAVALGRLGLGGLRCRNFTNLLRNYGCGLGTLLGRLLPLAVLLTIAFDFPDFVKAARFVASEIGDGVAKLEGQFDPHLPPLPPPRV